MCICIYTYVQNIFCKSSHSHSFVVRREFSRKVPHPPYSNRTQSTHKHKYNTVYGCSYRMPKNTREANTTLPYIHTPCARTYAVKCTVVWYMVQSKLSKSVSSVDIYTIYGILTCAHMDMCACMWVDSGPVMRCGYVFEPLFEGFTGSLMLCTAQSLCNGQFL